MCFLLGDGGDLEGGKKGNILDGVCWVWCSGWFAGTRSDTEGFLKSLSRAFPLSVPMHKQGVWSESPGAMLD